jgi:epoxyqueuosine reductase
VPPSLRIPAPELRERLRTWGREFGFADVGIARLELDADTRHLEDWLRAGFHGSMAYMARSVAQRAAPGALRPGTLSVVSARMDCTPPAAGAREVLDDGTRGYIARYALGRDYHRVLRQRLKRLAERMRRELGPFGYRVLADSAPVLEKALARNSRLGWIGKNTLVMSRAAGSFSVLG